MQWFKDMFTMIKDLRAEAPRIGRWGFALNMPMWASGLLFIQRPEAIAIFVVNTIAVLVAAQIHKRDRFSRLTSIRHIFGIEQGMELLRADLLHDAIALHSSVGIAGSREPEVAMVHYGAGADLFGLRLDEIAQLDLEHLLGEWPRCGFKAEFPTCLERQVELKPDSHIAGAMALGLAGRVRASPFAE